MANEEHVEHEVHTESTTTENGHAEHHESTSSTPDIDQASNQPYDDDSEQPPALPDWGPTDGKHGTDADDSVS